MSGRWGKFLWPSQNIWTLHLYAKGVKCPFVWTLMLQTTKIFKDYTSKNIFCWFNLIKISKYLIFLGFSKLRKLWFLSFFLNWKRLPKEVIQCGIIWSFWSLCNHSSNLLFIKLPKYQRFMHYYYHHENFLIKIKPNFR